MKKLLILLLLLSACAKSPTIVQSSKFAVPVLPVDTDVTLSPVTFENFSSSAYFGYAKATVPFAKGEVKSVDQLMGVTTEDGEMVDFFPLKWYLVNGAKDSIALAQAHFKVKMAPNSRRRIKLFSGKANVFPPFAFGSEIAKYLADGSINNMFVMSFTPLGGTPCYASPIGSYEFLQQSPTRAVIRVRTHPRCSGVLNNNVSFTLYWEFESGANHGLVTFVVGNDTLESPIGALQIVSADILIAPPLELGLFYPSGNAFGGVTNFMGYRRFNFLQNVTLGDGQTFAVRTRWGAFGPSTQQERQSFLVDANDSPLLEMMGLADFSISQSNLAFGPTGVLPKPRASEDLQRVSVRHHCTDNIQSTATGFLGYINQVPSSTGDQPDFMSGFPIFGQQALQAQSICPVRTALLAVMKESWRPSYYWWTPPDGIERRVEMTDWPDLFFFGRVHYDWSWNSGKGADIWQSRTQPFNAGIFGGWAAYDNQHFGFSSLRGAYELTGDVYLGEIIKYNQTIEDWDYYTGRITGRGWWFTPEAERAFGRMGKEVSQSFEYFPDNGSQLKNNFIDKTRLVVLPLVQNNVNTFHTPFMSPFEDPRVTLWSRCKNGEFEPGVLRTNCKTVVAWQTGFAMEELAQQIKNGQDRTSAVAIGQMYMDNAEKFFDAATGEPVTYFLVADPTIREFGGIGINWQTGWLNLAKYFPNHPKMPILDKFRVKNDAFMETRNATDIYWKGEDDWKSY